MATFLLHPVSTSEDNEEGLGSEKGGFCKDAELERIDHSGRSPLPPRPFSQHFLARKCVKLTLKISPKLFIVQNSKGGVI